jgi:hypothetical protein
MNKMIQIILVFFCFAFFGLALVACGDTNAACSSQDECAGTEECIWVRSGDKVVGKMCSIRCAKDSECPPGTSCSGGASTCPTCNDYIQVCQ